MSAAIVIQFAVIFALLMCAIFLSLAETSLVGMSRIKIIAHIKNGHPASKHLSVWLKEPNKLLATLSICVNAVAIGMSTIGAFLSMDIAAKYGLNEPLVASVTAVIITFVVIVFGEISPKVFAIRNTEKMGLRLVGPVVMIYRFIKPITAFFVKISNFLVRLAGGRPSESIPIVSAKDISTVMDVSVEEGFISPIEKVMMSRIMELDELQVKQVMIPRTSVSAIDIKMNQEQMLDLIIEEGYSRMPVYKGNLDHIVGIIYTKDVLNMIKNNGLIIFHDLIRMPQFVPETKKVSEILKDFRKGKFHMAIVVDEFGGTAGVVTLEDVLEEIVGEIQDEYDVEEKEVERGESGCYNVRGRVEISKLNEDYGFDLPDEEDINTIGGLVARLADRVPKAGESVTMGKLTFTVLKSDARKIERVKIEVKQDDERNKGENKAAGS